MARSNIGPVVTITDRDNINTILQALNYQHVFILEFAINGDGLRIKINGVIWSPPMGRITSEEW